ncbi:hypothetical protein BJ878DRAFT_479553 [Calycina marina]|uniref:Uncharacterized protein n=1 Tax=Calycina marina TaxID=1763456 RepID=A0A9P7Z549_9HELO|nr:hypothetical protein BJ878DRAFT_479553 [Calycina marina]
MTLIRIVNPMPELILYHLMKFPSSVYRFRQETSGAATSCDKEDYCHHSAVGLGLQRIVPQGGANLSGQYFPVGTTVAINAWVLYYTTTTWGDDTKLWRPERWLKLVARIWTNTGIALVWEDEPVSGGISAG